MANGFKLSVEQIVSAIGLLDEEEQSNLRLRLLAWLAGTPGVEPSERPMPSRRAEMRQRPGEPPADEDDLYLYDELMALEDE